MGTRGIATALALALAALPVAARQAAVAAASGASGVVFTDQASAAGVTVAYFNGMSGRRYMVEMVGGGAALFDADADGDLDLYLVEGVLLKPTKAGVHSLLPLPEVSGDRLFRNDLETVGGAALRFTEVTATAGISEPGYGQGIAVGDIDNDGLPDVYVTRYGANRLLRNLGGLRFERLSLPTDGDERWSTSASFFDYDRDGLLDLFVANYVDATQENHFNCTSDAGAEDYCGPLSFEPTSDVLLHNLGNGRFEDVSERAGISAIEGPGLGVVAGDFDGDGWLDVYVANDQRPNFLWRNQGDGTFREDAVLAGCAVSGEGKPQASMGVVADDLDGDGDRDLFLTHLRNETNTLYLNEGEGLFRDSSRGSGLGPPSLPFTSFGTTSLDFDNDGRLDLMVVSGEVRLIEEQLKANDVLPLRQPNQLFRGLGGGHFEEVSAQGGLAFSRAETSRGLAAGDIDNDGDTDVVVVNNGAPLELLINELGQERRWIGFRVLDGARDGFGAEVRLELGDGTSFHRWVSSDGSFLSAHDPRVRFGLGEGASPRRVTVRWLDGSVEAWTAPAVGRYHLLTKGHGDTLTQDQGHGAGSSR